MTITTGQIIKNLLPQEAVKVTDIKTLGSKFAIKFVGVNTQKVGNKIIGLDEWEGLELVAEEGNFRFDGDPEKFLLFAEAERINSAYQFDPLFAVNCSIVDPLPHQVEAVYRYLLPLPKIRFLLADDTGAGKTIMAGLLLKELFMRGIIERVLIITPGGLTKQWQEDEMGLKFNLDFKLVNRANFAAEPTIFANSNRLVTSIDFMRAEDVLNALKQTHWDLIIVDEAHKLSAFDYGRKKYVSKRYEAIDTLSQRCEHLLLLTATPHRGRRDTFKNLLQLLDRDIFASDNLVTSRIKAYESEGVNKFFIRRLKEQMRDWEGNPLYKQRSTRTVQYELTPGEKQLYDAVTDYLTEKREAAKEQKNIHVELTLMVMQRRLTSSIAAITKTLRKRYEALQGLVEELTKNPDLFKKRNKFFDVETDNIEDWEELDDIEREQLEGILSDPRKFKLFTTAGSLGEVKSEAQQVKSLYEMAQGLSQHREQKFLKLEELLRNQGVLDGKEKLVIFTEHKDTLNYLEDSLTNQGYRIATIHGGKNVNERRQAQFDFAKDHQILIATDAAGEGINLQFCRLLINWDIPWNPNRLEQRMGRIHRYGQKYDVLVFNLVAHNTREGKVLERLLGKLETIREQMGDDRVYDVINDIFENVSLDDILRSVFDGQETQFDQTIESVDQTEVQQRIAEQRNRLSHSEIDYSAARALKESSDEKRLQPIYVRMFFERAFKSLGGSFTEERPGIYRIQQLPELLARRLQRQYRLFTDLDDLRFCFDKEIFHAYQRVPDLGRVLYINPGNPLFDSLVASVREAYREDMLKGTILVSPEDPSPYTAFFVKTQIGDNRPHKDDESVADEQLALVYTQSDDRFAQTSPAKFLDLKSPVHFAKAIDPPPPVSEDQVIDWAYAHITQPQEEATRARVEADTREREAYLKNAFINLILDLNEQINELQRKHLVGGSDPSKKIQELQQRIHLLQQRQAQRLEELRLMQQLSPRIPQVLGCAYVVPLSQVEYQSHYGMSRDDEAEKIAMATAMQYERDQHWIPKDVSDRNEGYDIRSVSPQQLRRHIEVKGRNLEGGVMLSENEMHRLTQLGDTAWLYIVVNCATDPTLYRIHDPGNCLQAVEKSKGVQYFVPLEEWKAKLTE